MLYTALKHSHMTLALLSGALFLLRGIWMLMDSASLQKKWVRIVPHVIDTFLLLTAIALMVVIAQYPFVHGWVTAKLLALLAYIGLGVVALKRGRTKAVRSVALLLALAAYAYLFSVAFSKQPLGYFAALV